ncbi:MAG: glycosyltransferase family 4 protein [Methanotrichaceae archaeon]|nr:glycosyltransferase family 4 protein [Methanotrichaceae archaeon]
MRIGILSWESLYSIKVGGVAPCITELSEGLARRGHEMHIFTRRGEFDAFDTINGVHYQRVDFDESGDIVAQMDKMSNAMYDLFGEVQDIYGRFDIIHCHDWHPIPAAIRIKKDYGLPYILTMHSTEWGRNGNQFGYGISKEISHREWLGSYESSTIIVTIRRMMDELMWIYSIPKSKIRIIPNGIVVGKMRRSLDAGRVKEKYDIHPLAPMVLFCGRMSIQKGPDLLVDAIPHILKNRSDMKFVFIGHGDMKSQCEQRVRELNVGHACRFLGYTSTPIKERLMNACDLICIPSRNEPFGVVVLEAWEVCKPVVATEAVSIIRNFEDGLLAYIQPESIAWCINSLIKHPEEMRRLAMAGRIRLENEFDWDRIARKTHEVYANATNRSMLQPSSQSEGSAVKQPVSKQCV